MRLNLIVPKAEWFNPFNYCALMISKFFECSISNGYRDGSLNVLIYDLFHSLKWQKKAEIGLLDSPNVLDGIARPLKMGLIKPKIDRIYVTCQKNKEDAERVGVKVEDVIYRLCNPIAFDYFNNEKSRDFSIVGAYYPYDRKNLRLAAKVVDELNLDYEALTTAPFLRRKIRHGVDDVFKFRWLSSSRFLLHIPYNGSFEMPVYEAMACGVVPIYSEIPCLKEYAVGIPIKVSEGRVVKTVDGDILMYEAKKEDVIEAVKYALGLSRDTYNELRTKAYEKAKSMQSETLNKMQKAFNINA